MKKFLCEQVGGCHCTTFIVPLDMPECIEDARIGLKRQQLQQYARGVAPTAEVMLLAFLKWGITIRIEDEKAKDGDPKWWEFSMSGRDGGLQKPRPKPVQMSLFKAIEDLQNENIEVKILKKGPGRLEVGLDIGFKRMVF